MCSLRWPGLCGERRRGRQQDCGQACLWGCGARWHVLHLGRSMLQLPNVATCRAVSADLSFVASVSVAGNKTAAKLASGAAKLDGVCCISDAADLHRLFARMLQLLNSAALLCSLCWPGLRGKRWRGRQQDRGQACFWGCEARRRVLHLGRSRPAAPVCQHACQAPAAVRWQGRRALHSCWHQHHSRLAGPPACLLRRHLAFSAHSPSRNAWSGRGSSCLWACNSALSALSAGPLAPCGCSPQSEHPAYLLHTRWRRASPVWASGRP